MNNPVLLKSISIIAFIISALFTIQLMTSGTVGVIAWILTVGMAVILEACKCGFFYEAITNKSLNTLIRGALATIAVLLVASSIFASASYVQNQANKTKNRQIKTSAVFKQLEEGKALQQDLYNTRKKEIEDLKKLQDQQRTNGENIINSMPKNYIDRKNEQRRITEEQIAKTQETINAKSTELSQIESILQKPIDMTNVKVNDDAGYTAMFQSMADMINSNDDYKDNPVKAESLEMWFFISLGIIFEFTAILTAYLAQVKAPIAINQHNTNLKGIGFKHQIVTATKKNPALCDDANDSHIEQQEKRVIGFQIPYLSERASSASIQTPISDSFSVGSHETLTPSDVHTNSVMKKDVVMKYLRYMYASQKDNISSGCRTIAREIEIPEELARKIKGHLEQLKIIKSIGTQTLILKTLNEAIEII